MKTIFDIASPKELAAILDDGNSASTGGDSFALDRQVVKNSPDDSAGLLAMLYALRGDSDQMQQQLAAISDDQLRLDYMLLTQDLDATQ